MYEALIMVVLLCGLGLFFFAVYTLVSHPSDVDAEETAMVEAETPEEHTQKLLSEHHNTFEEVSKADEELYAHELP